MLQERPEPAPVLVEAAAPEKAKAAKRRRWAAAIAAAVVLAGGGIATVVITRPDGAACLSDPAMFPDAAGPYVSGMPREVDILDLPAPGPSIALGKAMQLQESEEMRHEVAVLHVDDLEPAAGLQPAKGRRLVSVLVRERNVGESPIIPQGDDNAWLCDADGTWYQHDVAMTALLADFAREQRLDSRVKVDQRVVFQIRTGSRPSRVRIVQNGYQWTKTGDWKV